MTTAAAKGTTRNAASANYADVKAQTDASVNGDTVVVPAGNVTWTQTLTLGSKAVSIIGAGPAQTIINNGIGTLFRWSNVGAVPFRLSGLRFNNTDSIYQTIVLQGPVTKIRVDNCHVNKGDHFIAANFQGMSGQGPVWGVVDHCKFVNMVRPFYPQDVRGSESHWGKAVWSPPVVHPGTDEFLYVETCEFVWDSNLTASNTQSAVYGTNGGSLVFRYNTCTGFVQYIDAHGDQPAGGGEGDLSTLYYEIYENTFTQGPTTQGNGGGNQRGGWRICYNNRITTHPSDGVWKLMVYTPQDVNTVKNTYYWGEVWNGKANVEASMVHVVDANAGSGVSAAKIRLNQEYFLRPPASGDPSGFYPYTALVYPHPLVSGTAIIPPEPPVIVEPPLMSGLSFQAEAGAVDTPYAIEGGLVLQHVVTTDPGQGGRARWKVTIPTAGDYQVKAKVKAEHSGADSLFMAFDAEPVTADQWTVSPVTAGAEERTNPKKWTLTAGAHTLYIRGRESDCALDSITVFKETTEPPIPPVPDKITIADVEGLQAALDAKADKGHQHTIPESQTT